MNYFEKSAKKSAVLNILIALQKNRKIQTYFSLGKSKKKIDIYTCYALKYLEIDCQSAG